MTKKEEEAGRRKGLEGVAKEEGQEEVGGTGGCGQGGGARKGRRDWRVWPKRGWTGGCGQGRRAGRVWPRNRRME